MSDTIRVELDEKVVSMGMSPGDRNTKTCGWFNSISGSDDGPITFAGSNTNFTEGGFQLIASELPASSWQILSFKKKY